MGLLDTLPATIKDKIMKDVSKLFLQVSADPSFEIVDMKAYFSANKIPPERNGYGEIIPGVPSAFYSFATNTMGFDKTAFETDFLKTLLSVAHESTHINQYWSWVLKSAEDKVKMLKGKKIPPEVQGYIREKNTTAIDEYLPDDLNHFWSSKYGYGYDKNPWEIEANAVARKNIKNILEFAIKKAQEYTKQDQTAQQIA